MRKSSRRYTANRNRIAADEEEWLRKQGITRDDMEVLDRKVDRYGYVISKTIRNKITGETIHL